MCLYNNYGVTPEYTVILRIIVKDQIFLILAKCASRQCLEVRYQYCTIIRVSLSKPPLVATVAALSVYIYIYIDGTTVIL